MYLLTTNPGMEDIGVNEIRSREAALTLPRGEITAKPFGSGGRILYTPAVPEAGENFLKNLRSVYNITVFMFHREFNASPTLEELSRAMEELDLEHWSGIGSFRVTCRRKGAHSFSSPEAAAAAGSVIVKKYGYKVSLKAFEKELILEVRDNHCFAGESRTPGGLDKRFTKLYNQRVSLKAPLAYGLLNLSGILAHPAPLIDPFCGSGTILMEAAALLPGLPLGGCDINPEAAAGARANLEALAPGLDLRIKTGDAQKLTDLFPESSFGYLVTNPPFGKEVGRRINYYWLYRHLLEGSAGILMPGGRLVMMTLEHRQILNRLIKELGTFRLLHLRVVEAGGLYPAVYVMEKKLKNSTVKPVKI